ncbi:SDR family oxidoreductase [Mesonia aestuariivivens]|uniref:SDR family oxidoreductase n=1 Tax=Mesonia aestuariivivens TaxID=2796128 RepID=A0ABS6VY11_9FLAO|nr:SDR family oxidoreductase [Mesonia aestuariivivens]MBW2960474.1 SDR family oxidoreductase [Mesonia aestuariivivens]
MILVTGATGLVGSHLLADLLLQESQIRALYRTKSKIKATKEIIKFRLGNEAETLLKKIEWVQADITKVPELEDAFEGIKFVYHCAGYISYNPKHYQLLRKINIEGTANVVNLSLYKNIKKFCHVSSIAALGSELGGKKITENSPRNNEAEHNNYSISKYGAEMEVWRASQEGLPVVMVNPGVIIGAGNFNTGSGILFSKINNKLSFYPPLVTGFVAVEDVTRAMVLLTYSSIVNEQYTLVAESCSFKQVLENIAEELDRPVPDKELKPWMVFIGWLFQYVGRKLFNTHQEIAKNAIKGAFSKSYYDHSKIKKELDFKFTPIKKSISKTAHYFKLTH